MNLPQPPAVAQGISSATVEELRQKLNLPTTPVLTTAKAAATYEPANPNIAQFVWINGTLVPQPVIAAGAFSTTSTGATGPYAVTFGLTFNSTPIVTVTPLTTTGYFAGFTISTVTATGFSFFIGQPTTPSATALPLATAFTANWIAVGT